MSGASMDKLHELHRAVAEQLTATIKRDNADEMPTDAATLSVAVNFLAKNNITSDPAESDVTSKLQEQFKEQARIRAERKAKALALAKTGTHE